jgi:uracil-DNA glycosylase family 4
MTAWDKLNRRIVACNACPRLRQYCQEIARQRRKAYAHETYWGQPVENFGDSAAHLLIVGLAPAAHGANRTGRMFTGDRSGQWLYRALHRAGFASQAESLHRYDPLKLIDCAITATCHCAPPDNKPTSDELTACQGWLDATIDLLPSRVFVALGQIAWRALVDTARRRAWYTGPIPRFAHDGEVALADGRWLIGSYHPSQQNTFTGRLTEPMFDAVFARARQRLLAGPGR